MIFNIPFSLIALAVGAFGIGLTEFVIMGLLPEVSTAMQVSIHEGGHFISAYAFGVVVGAPLLTIFCRSLPAKNQLIFLMIIFTVFNGLSALATDYTSLLILRFLSGLPHGAYFGIGGIVAARLAGEGKAASAFAVMLSGLTICNIFGVPLATYIGQITSWRVSFAMVSVVGILTIISISYLIPYVSATPKRKISEEFVIFKNPILWYIILFASIGFAGFFAWFSYITPVLVNITEIKSNIVPYLLSIAGLGMTVGISFGGKLADRIPPIKATIYLIVSMVFILILDSLFSAYPLAMYILTFLTAANAMALASPVQLLLMESTKESPFLGSALGQAAFNLGNSIGAFAGGIPLAMGLSLDSPWWVGAILSFAGVLIMLRIKFVAPKNYQGKINHGGEVQVH